jgi:hypothetical protein
VGNKIGKELLIEENIACSKRYYQTYLQHRSIQENTCLACEDPVTEQLKFPSGEVTIQHTADNFLLGEGLIAYHYLIFYLCFQ